MMFGNDWIMIATFVVGLMVGCAGTAWCVRFGIKAGYAIKHDKPIVATSKPESDDDMDAEFKMLDNLQGK